MRKYVKKQFYLKIKSYFYNYCFNKNTTSFTICVNCFLFVFYLTLKYIMESKMIKVYYNCDQFNPIQYDILYINKISLLGLTNLWEKSNLFYKWEKLFYLYLKNNIPVCPWISLVSILDLLVPFTPSLSREK